jgi:hypothetical protein
VRWWGCRAAAIYSAHATMTRTRQTIAAVCPAWVLGPARVPIPTSNTGLIGSARVIRSVSLHSCPSGASSIYQSFWSLIQKLKGTLNAPQENIFHRKAVPVLKLHAVFVPINFHRHCIETIISSPNK